MDSSFVAVFSTVCIFLSAFDFFFSYRAFQKTEKIGKWLGLSAASAGVVTLSYLYSILTLDYLHASILSSIYFLMIDWLLVCLVHFCYLFTGLHDVRGSRLIRRFIIAFACFDSLVFLINISREIAVHYVARNTFIAHFAYEMKPLYYAHLTFTYFLVVLALWILVRKSIRTPRQYRNQYVLIIASIALVVAVNAIFLYPTAEELYTLIDYSILGYSVGLLLMYWAAFDYRRNDMLKSLSMTIFENIGQGIVLFDYSDRLIMHNQKADRLLSGLDFKDDMNIGDFVELCQVPEDLRGKDRYSIQSQLFENSPEPVQCNFRRLQDTRGGTIGKLFVLSEVTNETDLLTGFQHRENFRRFALENPYFFVHPTAVAVFDINGLGHINRSYGREVGDRKIRNLVRVMRRCLPQDATFVRGYEANLVAVCPGKTEAELLPDVEAVLSSCGDSVLYGMGATSDRYTRRAPAKSGDPAKPASTVFQSEIFDIFTAVENATRALQGKKLLNSKSFHSQTISSLVRALQEADSDTEAHVQRTQKMGEALGRRIGLSDSQLTDLKVLCLLHDIGKIGIPLEILNKPGALTPSEWMVLKSHAEKGYQIAMSSDELRPIAPMILSHHERWDGNGYPEKLSGTNIPVLSRIICIVDSYDAMVNDRAYRKALTPEAAQEEIRRNAGAQFDPYLAYEFLLMLDENPNIALGEYTDGQEVRTFIQNILQSDEGGSTVPVHCSRYLLDLDDTIIEVDGNFEEITGYSAARAVGKMSQYDLVPEADRPYYMIQVNNQFSRGSYAYLRHNLQRANGEIIQILCYGKRYFDSAEKAFRSEILILPLLDLLTEP